MFKVRNIRIVRPLGFGLAQEAVETTSTWRFTAASRNGEPIDKEMVIEIDFPLY
jgi:Gram-negative bacterial TonB protein C-terminal